MNKKASSRFIAIDAWRGLAIIGMVIFHSFLILDYFRVVNYAMYEGGWLLMANSVRGSFLLLVGISLVISFQCGKHASNSDFYKAQIKRVLSTIAVIALIITAVTWYAIPRMYVSFGILHNITIGILMALPLATHPVVARVGLCLALLMAYLLSLVDTQSAFLHTLGANYQLPFSSMDFIPLFPWFVAIAAGVVLAQYCINTALFKKVNQTVACLPLIKPLAFMGRYSLRIYVIHIPALVAVFIILGWVDFYVVFPGLR